MEDIKPVHEPAATPSTKPRFYFDSDSIALKNNEHYQALLRSLAVYEAQKIRAIKDLETLSELQEEVNKDPCRVLDDLKNGSLSSRLPHRQHIAELPTIPWEDYTATLQALASTQSRHNTRKKITTAAPSYACSASRKRKRDNNGSSKTYGQQWTAEEQTELERLLQVFPAEEVESKRWQKIANSLGNRTAKQVCCRVQKYFIKLAKAGLPVPGRMPNLSSYTKKRRNKRGPPKRSTFLRSYEPRVYMTSGQQQEEEEGDGEDEEQDTSEEDEVAGTSCTVTTSGQHSSSASQTQHSKCSSCHQSLTPTYWLCSACSSPSVTLCSRCINSNWESGDHLSSHELLPADNKDQYIDTDYIANTVYSYLDPNFFPS